MTWSTRRRPTREIIEAYTRREKHGHTVRLEVAPSTLTSRTAQVARRCCQRVGIISLNTDRATFRHSASPGILFRFLRSTVEMSTAAPGKIADFATWADPDHVKTSDTAVGRRDSADSFPGICLSMRAITSPRKISMVLSGLVQNVFRRTGTKVRTILSATEVPAEQEVWRAVRTYVAPNGRMIK